MNVQLNLRMGKREFLTWVQSREGRYELAHRRVVMMTGGSRGHGLIVRRLASALERRLDAAAWTVLTSDFGVDIGGDTIRYPDVLVDRAGGRHQDLTATAPCLIAEVLSPSSINLDLRDKAMEYRRLPSLQAYLVLSHEEPKAWTWIRAEAGIPGHAETIAGRDAAIIIAELGITLPLGEIYPDIGTA